MDTIKLGGAETVWWERETLIVIDSDAELGRARVLVDRLMASDKPAELARLATQTRLMADYEEQKMGTPPTQSAVEVIRDLMDPDLVPLVGSA